VVVAYPWEAKPSALENDGDQTDQLSRYVTDRDPALRNQIVASHAGLAYRLARKFTGRGEPYDDLVQVASLGLILAVERFDPARGGTLVSFATLTILGELKRHFRDRAWSMRVPRRLQETYLEAKAVIDSLTQENGHSPTYQEIAARLEITNEELLEALEAGRNFYPLSFDGPAKDSSATVSAPAFDDPGLLSTEDRRFLSRLAEGLPAGSRRAVELRFNQDLTQAEIARELGISQMQVSRTLAKALRHMRERAQT